jgi:hypothetical protein
VRPGRRLDRHQIGLALARSSKRTRRWNKCSTPAWGADVDQPRSLLERGTRDRRVDPWGCYAGRGRGLDGRPGSIRAPSRGRHRSRGEVRRGGRVVRRARKANRARQHRRPVPVRTSRDARAYREAPDDSVGERGGQRRTRLPPWILSDLSDGQRPIVAASRCTSGRDRDQESHVPRCGYFETARLRATDVGLPFATAPYPEDPLKTTPASVYPTRFPRSACPHGTRIRP